jgi:hypothetical protein
MLRLLFRAVVYSVPIFQDLMGLLYPVLATTKAAIQEDSDACSGWLVYWAIYSIVALFETCCEWVISWLPLYPELKLAFVCWLVLPKFHGAALLYDRILQQLFLEYEEQIDDQITSAQTEARKHVWSFLVYLVAEGTNIAGEKSAKALSLFLSLSGLGSGSGEDVGEDAVMLVASAVASAVEKNLDKATAAAEGQTRISTVALKADAGSSKSGDRKSGDSGDSKSGESKSGDSKSSDSKSGDTDSGYSKGGDAGGGGAEVENETSDSGKEEVTAEANEEEATAEAEEEEANADLLSDFLRVMDDGVYLNVATAEAPGQVRLRIVTLSDDTFRLLWTNLRDLRKASNTASSLHLCTVTATSTPRDLCVSLSTTQELEAVSFEAQGSEVHDVLSAGLALLVADAHLRGRAQLAPLAASCRRRVLAETFCRLAAFGCKK